MNPKPGPSGQSSSRLNAQLKDAMAALGQKDYGRAIALLEPLLDKATKPSTQAQLRRNLAKAYMGQGDAVAALSQCQQLTDHADLKVQEWATNAIAHLHKRYPQLKSSAPASSPSSVANSPSSVANSPSSVANSTGFTPFNSPSPSAPASVHSESATGFTPLSPTPSPIPNATPFPTETSSSLTSDTLDGSSSPTPSSLTPDISSPSADFSDQFFDQAVPPSPKPTEAPGVSQKSKQPLVWKNAERAKRWSPISPKVTAVEQWVKNIFVHGWTAIALLLVGKFFVLTGMALGNPIRTQVERWIAFQRWFFLENFPGRVVLFILLGLLALSPWLLDLFLKMGQKAKSMTLADLGRYSPEAKQRLQESSRKQNHTVPTLMLLPTQTPVLMSYGLLPRISRIVVSEGLLRNLEDDELATLYAAELGHIRQWNLALITLVTLSTQISYSLFRFFSDWADGLKNGFLQGLGATLAAIAYGMFWLVRSTGLWLARFRFESSDRAAVNLTGNPNGLTRALLKQAIATATDIRRQGHTPPVLEQFEWLMPVGYRTAISSGSVFPAQWTGVQGGGVQGETSTILDWDYRNPQRHWLTINNTHPPLGDRLYRLSQYAKKWKLEPELQLAKDPGAEDPGAKARAKDPGARDSSKQSVAGMIIQVAPFAGIGVGAAIALICWSVGVLADQFNWRAFEWLEYDSSSVFWAMLAFGFSCGTIFRFNHFFPEIKPSTRHQGDLAELLTSAEWVPADSQPVQLEGKMLGRRGTGNWLNQDLILQTDTGLIRLHCISMLGAMGNLIFDVIRLQSIKGRPVTVTGWLRRGATPWIDVETIKSQRGKSIQAGHPIWSMFLALAAALWGAYTLYS